MSDIISIPPGGGSRADVRRIADALLRGEIAALPGETGYLLAAQPLAPAATARLASLAPVGKLSVCLADPESAEDFVPPTAWTAAAQRLARRCWPGPLIAELPASGGASLFEQWPADVQRQIISDGWTRLSCDAHPLLREVARELPWPLIAAASSREAPDVRWNSLETLPRTSLPVALQVDAGLPRYQERSTAVRVHADRIEVIEDGIIGRRTVTQLASQIVLFVCTGNTCRSPMAEALFRQRLAERLGCDEDQIAGQGVVVLSAGLATTPGMPASEHAVELLREQGLDLTGHHSQSASPELLNVADQVVTMTRSHRDSILSRFPELQPRVRLLSSEGRDISDPFGGDLEDYRRCRDEIDRHMAKLLDALTPPG